MNEIAIHRRLVQLIERAHSTLASTTSTADILDARVAAMLGSIGIKPKPELRR
jgi:hypothetical protein